MLHENSRDLRRRSVPLGRAYHTGCGEYPVRLGGKVAVAINCGGSVFDDQSTSYLALRGSAHEWMRVGVL